ncbi:MAG: hypothetical protein Q8P51_07575 [Ignavibacteria bacterium]|nr:hypothetical protein [Ignavibacteria bacterium]
MLLSETIALVPWGTGALGSVIADRRSSQEARFIASIAMKKGWGKSLDSSSGFFMEKVTMVKADVADEQEVIAPLRHIKVCDGSG